MKTAKHTMKRMLALCAVVATLLTLLALPVSAKSSGGFRYYLEGPYTDDGETLAVITGYDPTVNGTLTIPETIGGYKVWSVNEGAFMSRKDVKKVVIPTEVGSIDAHAFEDCTNLRTVVIGSAYVCEDAFAGCTSLKKVKITAYKGDMDPEYAWSEEGNDALFGADREWTHYKKDEPDVTTCMTSRTGRKVTLEAQYDHLKKGESYQWYGVGIFPEGDGVWWEDCTDRTVTCTTWYSGDAKAVCEVVNSKGDVVWSQEFDVEVRTSLKDEAERVVYNTYLYSVTQFTANHFRWKVMDLLEKMGVDVYGGSCGA